MDSETKKYLVTVRLKNDSSMSRIATDCPEIIQLIKGFSSDAIELVFRSNDGILFGHFIKTNQQITFIRAEFEKLKHTVNEDSILIIELGKEFNGLGFSRAWTWLQRH